MAEYDRILPEKLIIDFVICDNTVNRYGWRLLVEGIDISGFLKNPVCCFQHQTKSISVGRWFNIRIEDSKLKGTVEFDRNDDLSVKLYWKYKEGYMNAVSLSVITVAKSNNRNLFLPGQKGETITQSELIEVSLVTIPGQKNAVKLSASQVKSNKLDISKNDNNNILKPKNKMEEIIQKIDALIAANESLINSTLDTKSMTYVYNKIAKLNQLRQLAVDCNDMR